MGSCYLGDKMLKTMYTKTKQHVTLRNHTRITAMGRSVIGYWKGGGGGKNKFNRIQTSTSASAMLLSKENKYHLLK